MAQWVVSPAEHSTGDLQEIEIVANEPDFVVGHMGRLVVLRTRAPMSIPALDALYAQVLAVAEVVGPHVATVVVPGAPKPGMTADVRARAVTIWPVVEDMSDALALWIRQGSFAGAIQQSIATAVLLMVARRKPVKACSKAKDLRRFFIEAVPDLEESSRDWPAALSRFASAFDPPGVYPLRQD